TARPAHPGGRTAAVVTAARGAIAGKNRVANAAHVQHAPRKAGAESLDRRAAGPMSTSHNCRMTTNWKVSAAICWRTSAHREVATMRDRAGPAAAEAAADVVEPPHG